MTARSGHKAASSPFSRRWRWALMVLSAVVVAGVAVYFYDYVSMNLWLEGDAGRLQNYSVHLIENQKEVADNPDHRFKQIDRLLIEEMRRDRRNVVTLSRSEIKCNLLRTRACVKVFLETALPDQPDRRSRLSIICELKRNAKGWRMAGPPVEKTIE
jgi:hypothetical protein